MGGYLGIGHSSAKTDRGNQLAATQGDWNLFSYGLPKSQASEDAGTTDLSAAKSTLGPAKDYWDKLLSPGRTEAAAESAPAVNQVLANETATRNAEGTFGTDRTGGTAAANREASSRSGSKIDDIINSTLMAGREEGAKGLQSVAQQQSGIGGTELSHAMSLLGLSSNAVNSILENSTKSRVISNEMNLQTQQQWGELVGSMLMAGGV